MTQAVADTYWPDAVAAQTTLLLNQAQEIEHLNRQIELLKAERGIFITVLEQIRAAPIAGTSWEARYRSGVRRANYALEHLKRAVPTP